MGDIREKLANRLNEEMTRKGMVARVLAERSTISEDIITEYLQGVREVRFGELNSLCEALGTDLLWLMSPTYKPLRLVYRKVGRQAMAQASAVENAFLLVHERLPSPEYLSIAPVPESDSDALMVLLELDRRVRELRVQHRTPESLYNTCRLPVLGVNAGDEFDGFLMMAGRKSLVCVNNNRPYVRLEFTLLHEFAHFLFDSKRQLPVDVRIEPSDFYKPTISPDVRAEYIANKFAQLFLVALDTAGEWAEGSEPERAAAEYVQERGVSPEVAANALYDAFLIRGQRRNYAPLRDSIRDLAGQYNGRHQVRDFVSQQTDALLEVVLQSRNDFGDGRWKQVTEAWGGVDVE